jgi:outer membrane receptor protein involved in Fe transport
MSYEPIAGRAAAARFWCALAVVLLGPVAGPAPPARAQEVDVSGVVIDATTREPLTDVTVTADGQGVSTESGGRFTIRVANDSVLVTIRRIGYRPVALEARAMPAEIVLRRAPVVLKSLGVTASAARRSLALSENSQLCFVVANRSMVAERATPALAEALETTEGVSTSRPGSWGAKAFVRGLGGERLAVLLDGNRINRACCVSMDAGLATLNPDNIERVEVLAGPGSTLYGSGNVGGVINVVTRGPQDNSPLEGEVRMSASSGIPGGRLGATLWGRGDRFAFTASADGASYGNQRSPEGTIEGSSFRDATVDLTGNYGLNGPHRLDARVQRYVGRDIGYPGSTATIPEEDRLLLALDYGWQASRGLLDGVNAKVYLQSVDHHMLVSMIKGTMRTDTDAMSYTDTWGGRAHVRLDPARDIDVDAGIEAVEWDAEATRWVERQKGTVSSTLVFHTWPGVRVTDLGAFTQGAVSFTPWLDASAGARLDHVLRSAEGFDRTTEWVGSGNLGVRVTSPRGPYARAGIGFGYRVPDPTELYGLLLRPDGFVYQGDPNLVTETSQNLEASAGYADARMRASATVFQNEIRDFISTVVTGDSVSGIPIRQYGNIAMARIDGVTGSAGVLALRWLDLRGTASWTRGEKPSTGAPLPAIAPFEATAAARFSPGGPWPWIEPEVLVTGRQDRLASGEVETPGFETVNLRAGRTFGSTGVTVGAENLLDRSYRRHLDPATILRPGINAFIRLTQRM